MRRLSHIVSIAPFGFRAVSYSTPIKWNDDRILELGGAMGKKEQIYIQNT